MSQRLKKKKTRHLKDANATENEWKIYLLLDIIVKSQDPKDKKKKNPNSCQRSHTKEQNQIHIRLLINNTGCEKRIGWDGKSENYFEPWIPFLAKQGIVQKSKIRWFSGILEPQKFIIHTFEFLSFFYTFEFLFF